MTIRVLYFASLREQMGRAVDEFDFSVDELSSMNIAQVWQHASKQTTFPEDLLVAVNQEYTDQFASINDGDEIAFFPPVTGG